MRRGALRVSESPRPLAYLEGDLLNDRSPGRLVGHGLLVLAIDGGVRLADAHRPRARHSVMVGVLARGHLDLVGTGPKGTARLLGAGQDHGQDAIAADLADGPRDHVAVAQQ